LLKRKITLTISGIKKADGRFTLSTNFHRHCFILTYPHVNNNKALFNQIKSYNYKETSKPIFIQKQKSPDSFESGG